MIFRVLSLEQLYIYVKAADRPSTYNMGLILPMAGPRQNYLPKLG